MNHPLINLWLENPSAMPAEQLSELHAHVQTCAECKRTFTAWTATETLISTSPVIQAPGGFSTRFQASLAERRARLHRRQIRTFFLVLLGAILVASSFLLVRFLSVYSPIEVLGQGIHFVSTAPARVLELRYIFSFWLGEIPPAYLVLAAIIFSGWTFIILLSWVLAIFRIRHQGVTK